MKKRKQNSPEFKAQVVIEVLREERTINEIAAKYEINPVMLSRWKTEFVNRSSDIFKKGPTETDKELEEERQHVAELERKVGQLAYEVDWLKKKMLKFKPYETKESREMVEHKNPKITVKR